MLRTLFDRRRDTSVSPADARVAHACASWLIGYPTDQLIGTLDTIRTLAADIDPRLGEPLLEAATALGGVDLIGLREEYVDTFDTRRKGCLYLTYYSNGDTRRRGMALVRIKDAYRRAGLNVDSDELPDHLPVVLEFSAGTSLEGGLKILTQNRSGLELLRTHLENINSPWHGAVLAVCRTLPAMSKEDLEQMLLLAAEGPEEEMVGLDGYGDGPFDQIYPASRPGPSFDSSSCSDSATPARGPQPITLERSRP